jgi:hypothetical protein
MALLSIGYAVHYNLALVIRNNFLIMYLYYSTKEISQTTIDIEEIS